MQFDKLSGGLEKHARKHAKILEQSKLFLCDESVLENNLEKLKAFVEETQNVEELALRIRLPFPKTSVQISDDYVTMFEEVPKPEMDSFRMFYALTKNKGIELAYHFLCGKWFDKNNWVAATGGVFLETAEAGEYDGCLIAVVMQLLREIPEDGYFALDPNMINKSPLLQKTKREIAEMAIQSLQAIFHLNASGDFVVEKNPRRDNKKRKKKHKRNIVRRTDERPHYIFIKPKNALEFFNPGGWGHKKTPHARRGHLRRYQDGKVVWVRATWVGLQKRTDKNARYKIMLDI